MNKITDLREWLVRALAKQNILLIAHQENPIRALSLLYRRTRNRLKEEARKGVNE